MLILDYAVPWIFAVMDAVTYLELPPAVFITVIEKM